MNKKQFYYLTRIIEEMLLTAVIIIVSIYSMIPLNEESLLAELFMGVIVFGVSSLCHYRVKNYIKKAFDDKKPESDEQEDLKELEK